MIKVTGTLTPNGKYPVVSEDYLKGSYRSVETIEDRDNISENFLKEGMLVYILKTKELYRYENQKWVLLSNFNSDYKVKVDENDSEAGTLNEKIKETGTIETEVDDTNSFHQLKLSVKDNSIDVNKLASNIDATGKSFNADKVDGKDVDDNKIDKNSLWTSERIKKEIDNNKTQNFTELEDTPNSYENEGGKLVVVKDDETGLEFKSVDDLGLSQGTGSGLGETSGGASDIYKVKLDDNDENPDYLANKIDNKTIISNGDTIQANLDDTKVTEDNMWSAQKTKKQTIISAIIFG